MVKRSYKCFFVAYNTIDTNKFFDVNRYLMKETLYKIMLEFI